MLGSALGRWWQALSPFVLLLHMRFPHGCSHRIIYSLPQTRPASRTSGTQQNFPRDAQAHVTSGSVAVFACCNACPCFPRCS